MDYVNRLKCFFTIYKKGPIKLILIYAEYNPQTNSIDATTFENYILRINCNMTEESLKTTPYSQNSLNILRLINH